MTIAKRSRLRALVNRNMKLSGDYEVGIDDIEVPNFEVFNLHKQEYQDKQVQAGDSVLLLPNILVSSPEHLLLLKVPAELHAAGMVSYQTTIGPTDRDCSPVIRFEADKDIDLSSMGWVLKLYVME